MHRLFLGRVLDADPVHAMPLEMQTKMLQPILSSLRVIEVPETENLDAETQAMRLYCSILNPLSFAIFWNFRNFLFPMEITIELPPFPTQSVDSLL